MQRRRSMSGLRKGQRLRKNRAAILARKRQRARRQREREARQAATVPRQPAMQRDPIWSGETTPAVPPPPRESGHEPIAPPEPEPEPQEPKPEPKYIRHAARLKVPKGEVGPRRAGESARSWRQPEDRNPCAVPVDPDDVMGWKN